MEISATLTGFSVSGSPRFTSFRWWWRCEIFQKYSAL